MSADIFDLADEQAAEQLASERLEALYCALYDAQMLGLPDKQLRVLCAEAGVPYADLCAWTHPILRRAPSVGAPEF